MKRFIIRASIFIGTVLLVFGSICGVELVYELNAYRREIKAPPSAHILVCNDSQLEMSVNPAVDDAFFNFSASGRTMDQAYLAMLDIFAANPGQFKTVVIDFSPSAAADKFDQAIPDMGYAAQYYLLHWLHPKENRRDMTGQIAVFRDNMVGRRWRLFSRSLRGKAEFTSSICGRFKPADVALAVFRPDDFSGQWKARANGVNMADSVTPDSPVFTYAEDIIRLVRANGAEPVVMTTPWHSALLKAVKPEKLASFESAVAGFAKKHGCKYVNLLRAEFPDKCWYDAQHLNEKGAKLFTPMLRNAL